MQAGLSCERCGTFADAFTQRREQRVCMSCSARLEQEQRSQALYPPGFIWALGVLTNGTVSSGLAAVNWKRIGEAERARTAWVLSGLCALVTAVVVAVPRAPGVVVLLASIAATRQALAGWGPIYEAHHRAGGRRASLLLVIAVILGILSVIAAVVLTITVVAIADPER